MKKPNAIIVGGTGQFGITLSKQLLKKKNCSYNHNKGISKGKKKVK